MTDTLTGAWSWTGALLGLLTGLGLTLVWARLPFRRRLTVRDRIDPYLQDLVPVGERRRRDAGLWGAVTERLGGVVDRVLGGADSVERRQARAGLPVDLAAFRAEQVLWGSIAGGVALVLAALGVWADPSRTFGWTVLVVSATGGGVVARDWWLSRAAERREALMAAEFPTVAELLALSVGAGEGAAGALERVCSVSRGELSAELRAALGDARAGMPLPDALQGLADRTGLPSLRRFVDGIVIAVERGTPLADVLRAQAQDVRDEGMRQVMEAAGKKEVGMMIPVVFLILPVTVLFAVWPGLALLQLSV